MTDDLPIGTAPDAQREDQGRQEPPQKELKTAEDVFEPHILAKYDPEVVKLVLRGVNSGLRPIEQVSIAERRADPARFRAPWSKDTTGLERVADHEVVAKDGAKIPVKVYHPDPEVYGPGPYGLHLNFHGGGFVLGDLQSESSLCLSMRDGAGVVVVDVNYRHCPEVEWGVAYEDAWAALQWAKTSAESLKIRPDSVSVGGVSAGGQISIVLQHFARDAGTPLKLCMASVPAATRALTYKFYTDSPFGSFHEFYRGPVLPWAAINYFGVHSFPRDKLDERVAKLPDWWLEPLAAKNWTGLGNAYIRTAECDPLRDEGEAYALKLAAGGNQVTLKRYIGCPHTFMYLAALKQKEEYDQDSIRALKQAHGTD